MQREITTAPHEFLARVIDYAGMFPPASLALAEAVRNYASYVTGADAWMLGRFVCFASQLSQLDAYVDLFDKNAPLKISALGAKNPALKDFETELDKTRQHIKAFNLKWGARGGVDALEFVLPDQPFKTISSRLLEQDGLESSQGLSLFLEIPFNSQWSNNLPHILDACARQGIGFKLRTGGVIASAFPTSAQLARAILACKERDVPMKCTAGLHHPLRRYDASVRTEMHGFVNVFAAAILAHARELDAATLQELLDDVDAKNFCWSADGLAWHDHCATIAEIARARHDTILSFGSCSFDEPRAELRALSWL